MVMVTHDRVGANINGINVGEKPQTGDQPLFAMIKILPRKMIDHAQKCAADAAHVAMVKRRGIEVNLFSAGTGHGEVPYKVRRTGRA